MAKQIEKNIEQEQPKIQIVTTEQLLNIKLDSLALQIEELGKKIQELVNLANKE